jgi:hypothetical protein
LRNEGAAFEEGFKLCHVLRRERLLGPTLGAIVFKGRLTRTTYRQAPG